MAIDLVTRNAWGARAPRGSYSNLTSTRGVKVHYTGGRVDPRILDDHDRCVAAVRGIQGGHMDGNGWMDIGYSLAVCPHRKVFVGRGPRHLPAANGPGLNSGHYAVLGLVGNTGLVKPPDAMLHGIVDAIEYLRAEGGAGREIKGHRDGYSTSCPGAALYAWVTRGAPRPSTGPAPHPVPKPEPQEQEIDVPEYGSFGLSDASGYDVQANTWTNVNFDTEWADPLNDHVDAGANPSILDGPHLYTAALETTLTGLPAGAAGDVRFVEIKSGTTPGDILEAGAVGRWTVGDDGTANVHHVEVGSVQEGRKLRAQIRHAATVGTVRVTGAKLRMVVHR
jgi:hypothetical protein